MLIAVFLSGAWFSFSSVASSWPSCREKSQGSPDLSLKPTRTLHGSFLKWTLSSTPSVLRAAFFTFVVKRGEQEEGWTSHWWSFQSPVFCPYALALDLQPRHWGANGGTQKYAVASRKRVIVMWLGQDCSIPVLPAPADVALQCVWEVDL